MFNGEKSIRFINFLTVISILSLCILFFLNSTIQNYYGMQKLWSWANEKATAIGELLPDIEEGFSLSDLIVPEEYQTINLYDTDLTLLYSTDGEIKLGETLKNINEKEKSQKSFLSMEQGTLEFLFPLEDDGVPRAYIGVEADQVLVEKPLRMYIAVAFPILAACILIHILIGIICIRFLDGGAKDSLLNFYAVYTVVQNMAFIAVFQWLWRANGSSPLLWNDLWKNGLLILIAALAQYKICEFYHSTKDTLPQDFSDNGRVRYNSGRFVFLSFVLPLVFFAGGSCIMLRYYEQKTIEGVLQGYGFQILLILFIGAFLLGLICSRFINERYHAIETLKSGIVLYFPGLLLALPEIELLIFPSMFLIGFSIGVVISSLYEIVFQLKDVKGEERISFSILSNYVIAGTCGICVGALFRFGKERFFLYGFCIAALLLLFFGIGITLKPFVANRSGRAYQYPGYYIFKQKPFYFQLIYGWIGCVGKMLLMLFFTEEFSAEMPEMLLVILYIAGVMISQMLQYKVWRRIFPTKGGAGAIFILAGVFLWFSLWPSTLVMGIISFIIGMNDGAAIIFCKEYVIAVARKHSINEVSALFFLVIGVGVSFAAMPFVQEFAHRIGISNEAGILSLCFMAYGIVYLVFMGSIFRNKRQYYRDIPM